MKINPGDTVSGEFFLKFLNQYKEYDQKQKERIRKYERKIELLEWEIESLKEELEEIGNMPEQKLRNKLKAQRKTLCLYTQKIVALKEENALLKAELGKADEEDGTE